MKLYCNIVKTSLVGGGLHHLLKVIPVSHKPSESYITIEFQHLEFLDISTSSVEYLNFELRSYAGSLIQFSNPN